MKAREEKDAHCDPCGRVIKRVDFISVRVRNDGASIMCKSCDEKEEQKLRAS